jgi:hypothetical protein
MPLSGLHSRNVDLAKHARLPWDAIHGAEIERQSTYAQARAHLFWRCAGGRGARTVLSHNDLCALGVMLGLSDLSPTPGKTLPSSA